MAAAAAEGGSPEQRSLGTVRLPPLPWSGVCVFTKRNLQLLPSFLPRFRRTVGAVPPRYALPETVAAKVTEGGGERTEGAGGPKKKERLRLLPPSLIHPISHTFLSHLAEYAAEDCHLSVRPSASCPCVRLLWPTISTS